MHASRSVGLFGVMLVLLACKQSEGDTGSSPASSGSEDARVAAVGIGGTLEGAESDAERQRGRPRWSVVSCLASRTSALALRGRSQRRVDGRFS